MKKTTALAIGLSVAAAQSLAHQQFTCESTESLPEYGRTMRLVLTVPEETVLEDARLTLSLRDRKSSTTEALTDPLRTAVGSLSVHIGRPSLYPFVVLNYPSMTLKQDAGNSLRGFAIDKDTSTVLSLAIFKGKAGFEFVAFDHLLAPSTVIRGRCDSA